jgi:hypothetical protein
VLEHHGAIPVGMLIEHDAGGRGGQKPRQLGLALVQWWRPKLHQLVSVPHVYFGITLGSPPGVPGGGMTGIIPPPAAGAEIPGSTPAGGQITPFERDIPSLRFALPVVSPGAGKEPRWQSLLGNGEIKGGRSDCADAKGTPPNATIMVVAMNHARTGTSQS